MKLIALVGFAALFACSAPKMTVEVENKTELKRTGETVEIAIEEVKSRFADPTKVIVTDADGKQIPLQFTAEKLLFQVDVAPGGSARYVVTTGTPEKFAAKTYGRAVPERMDDWAWESDKIAFRMYGPALEATGELSNGIDVWVKSTPELVINKWYKLNDYHRDYGEGLDGYKVGRTLGAGAMAPVVDGMFVLGNNYIKAELLDSGAIRHTFRLSYAPYSVKGRDVKETRVVSLDAGSNLNKITEIYEGDFETLEVAAGIVLREGGEVVDLGQGVIYIEPEMQPNGATYLALIMPSQGEAVEIENHITERAVVKNGVPYTYITGAGWSKGGFATAAHWEKYVKEEIVKLNNPLLITIN